MAFKYLDYNKFNRRHISPSAIGQRLGLGEKTVRTRIKRMEAAGFIQYYEAIPNLSLFGLSSMGFYNFEASDISSKQDALGFIRRAPGVVEAFDMIGPSFSATLAGTSPQEVDGLANHLTTELKLRGRVNVGDRIARSPTSSPDGLDWRLIQRLRYDALSPTNVLANDLAVTSRVAEYRINRLLRSGTMFIRAAMDPQSQGGLIFYGLFMRVDEASRSAIIERMKELYGEKLWLIMTPMKDAIMANVFGLTLGEPESAVTTVVKLRGVKRCSLSIFKGNVEPERPSWIDAHIAKMISEYQSKRNL